MSSRSRGPLVARAARAAAPARSARSARSARPAAPTPVHPAPPRRLLRGTLAAVLLIGAAAAQAQTQAAAPQRLCVYDMVGTSGDQYTMTRDYVVAMQRHGVSLQMKGYTDERVAVEDFRTGQCDAVMATGLRTRQFNGIAATLDALGATTIVRNGKIDMPASYEVVRQAVAAFTSPAAIRFMVEGNYEVGGILPVGAAYPMVRDRRINSVEALAGKRIAAFDHDKAQALMIQRIGAQPVSADVTNFATKFNNGMVDMIVAPALAYRPLELYKGLGKQGAVGRFPLLILTYQVILNRSKFPPGFGEKSRQYWLDHFDGAMSLVANAESSIPGNAWMDFNPDDAVKYTLMLRQARIDIAEAGFYNKRGLRIIKKVRCSINPGDSECSTPAELEWK